jgi:CRISPR-associated protein Cmr2
MHTDTADRALFWKQKLAAFLHDPPSKALDIGNHQENARPAYSAVGLEPGIFLKQADWTASAADRLPFPSGQIRCAFDGSQVTYRHPLCGIELPLPDLNATAALEKSQLVQPNLRERYPADWQEPEIWRAKHFAHWRKWREHTTQNDWRLEFFPADTRIPDHSIWHHMSVVSALGGCMDPDDKLKPAFLKLQIGPVQDFIAAAKSVRDLWSGSYLLSWLMAAGLKALSAEVGPDSVLFPSLYQQPLFDLHWRDDLWSKVSIGDKSVWESWGYSNETLLVPNLPNVFLAVIPAHRAEELGDLAANAIRDEWRKISEACWDYCKNAVRDGVSLTQDESESFTEDLRKSRFDGQIDRFLQISWVAEPWPDTLEAVQESAAKFNAGMPVKKAADAVETVVRMATQQMPEEHRDERYYQKPGKEKLNNVGVAWAAILQHVNWKLDAVRQTRPFQAWAEGGWQFGSEQNKDALNGKEEAVAGGKIWHHRCQNLGDAWRSLFKTDAWVGASTLVKRVWHLAYLKKKFRLRTDSAEFPMPDTREIARSCPETDEGIETYDKDHDDSYFAVLALDGDEIGKWVSGEKNQPFSQLLAPPAKAYFEDARFKGFLDTRRPLSPGFHLQFSETLSNFALRAVPEIVRAHSGRLIYAGGDDVLAMLPAHTAMDCARDLRSAFQGKKPVDRSPIQSPAPGFLTSAIHRQASGAASPENELLIPFPVPGPESDVSVGIAIAHFKHPLQDVVRAAQTAEKRAKNELDRAAISLSVLKRSGEILHWGSKWESGGIDLFQSIATAMTDRDDSPSLSGKFPHRVCQLLTPYLNAKSGISTVDSPEDFPVHDVIRREFEFAATRQGSASVAKKLLPLVDTYLQGISPDQKQDPVESVIGLCRSVAFALRSDSNE